MLDKLGPAVIGEVTVTRTLDRSLNDIMVHDRLVPPHFQEGDLVLAVGVDVGSSEAFELMKRAARVGAAAVVFKSPAPTPPELEALAERHDIALARVQLDLDWAQVHKLILTARSASDRIGATDEMAGLGDLFALANAAAAMIGGPVIIDDPQLRVLAYSNLDEPVDELRKQSILGRQPPEAWMKRLNEGGVLRHLRQSDEVVRLEGSTDIKPEGATRLGIAVRAGMEVLGVIWVAEGRRRLDGQAEAALREVARIAALHLIRYQNTEDLRRRRRRDLLWQLLQGQGDADAVVESLGMSPADRFRVVAFELGGEGDEVLAARQRAADLIELHFQAYRHRVSSAHLGTHVYTLVPVKSDDASGLTKLVRGIIEQGVPGVSRPIRAGIGPLAMSPADISFSHTTANRVLEALDASDRAVAAIEDVRSPVVLAALTKLLSGDPLMKAGKVEELALYDERHGSDYLESLVAYLDYFGNMAQAADHLSIHPNTLRYRIARLSELVGLDLNDPVDRFVAELQARTRPRRVRRPSQ